MTAARPSSATGAETVFLHVGLMKTGTTYLQSRLKEHRAELLRDGVVVPSSQLHAVRDRFGRRGTLHKRDVDGAWEKLLTTLRTTPATVGVVSMEFLSTASAKTARDIVRELAPADVHVVVTVRDLARVLAAQWQESIQNRAAWTWSEYSGAAVDQLAAGLSPSTGTGRRPEGEADGLDDDTALDDDTTPDDDTGPGDDTGPDDGTRPPDGLGLEGRTSEQEPPTRSPRGGRTAGDKFWRQQDVVRIVADWAAAAGPDNVHLVTVPRPGSPPDLLWQRFADVLGVDPQRYQRADEPIRANIGLDLGASEFLRRLNARLQPDIPRSAYIRTVKHVLGKRALVGRGAASKPQLTTDQHEQVLAHTSQLLDHFTALGVDVVGDLAELVPAEPSPTGSADAQDLDRQVADAAIDAVLAMIRHVEALGPLPPEVNADGELTAGSDGESASARRKRRHARRSERHGDAKRDRRRDSRSAQRAAMAAAAPAVESGGDGADDEW